MSSTRIHKLSDLTREFLGQPDLEVSPEVKNLLRPETLKAIPDAEEFEDADSYEELKAGFSIIKIPEGDTPEVIVFSSMVGMCKAIEDLEGFEGAVIPVIGSVLNVTKPVDGHRAVLLPEDNYVWLDQDVDRDADVLEPQEAHYLGSYRYIELMSQVQPQLEVDSPEMFPVSISEETDMSSDIVIDDEQEEGLYGV